MNQNDDDRELLLHNHHKAMRKNLFLAKNAKKGTWKNQRSYDLLCLLEKEVKELKSAVWAFEYGGDPQRVIDESADVGIFAAMVADVCSNPVRDVE